MDTQSPITLPKKRQTRTVIFGIRLTQTERDVIRAFARQINFPASEMARHFVLQAIAYHAARQAAKGSIDAAQS
jgi:type IV pilus biogenesis protein CpaD/CtpE